MDKKNESVFLTSFWGAALACALLSLYLSSEIVIKMIGRYWHIDEMVAPFGLLMALQATFLSCFYIFKAQRSIAISVTLFMTMVLFKYGYLISSFSYLMSLLIFLILTCIGIWGIYRSQKFREVLYFMVIVHCFIFSTNNLLLMGKFYCCMSYDVINLSKKENILSDAYVDLETAPDIYIIFQDAYASSDTLLRLFNHDNKEFIKSLKNHNLYHMPEAKSSYTHTLFSISSTLNLNYFQNDINLPHTDFFDNAPAHEYFLRPRLIEFLRNNGYEIHVSSTGYNIDMTPDRRENDIRAPSFQFSALEVLMTFTPLHNVLNLLFGGQRTFLNPYRDHYNNIRNQYKFLQDQAVRTDQEKPRLIYAHIMLPHPPFVFSAAGKFADYTYNNAFSYNDGAHHPHEHFFEEGWQQYYRKGYTAQVAYLEKQLSLFIDKIMSQKSERPFVIIIQGDHGSRIGEDFTSLEKSDPTELFGIMNVVYFSDEDYNDLRKNMNSVNTMRTVINKYFGSRLPMLEEQQWYSPWEKPYKFIEVSKELQQVR